MEAEWINLFGQMGIGGILCWYLYFTTSVLMPRLYDAQQSGIRQIVEQFREDLQSERGLRMVMHDDLQTLLSRLSQRPCLLPDREENH